MSLRSFLQLEMRRRLAPQRLSHDKKELLYFATTSRSLQTQVGFASSHVFGIEQVSGEKTDFLTDGSFHFSDLVFLYAAPQG